MGNFSELPFHLPARKKQVTPALWCACWFACPSKHVQLLSAAFTGCLWIPAAWILQQADRYCILVFSLDPKVAHYWRRIMSFLSRALRKDFLFWITLAFTRAVSSGSWYSRQRMIRMHGEVQTSRTWIPCSRQDSNCWDIQCQHSENAKTVSILYRASHARTPSGKHWMWVFRPLPRLQHFPSTPWNIIGKRWCLWLAWSPLSPVLQNIEQHPSLPAAAALKGALFEHLFF